MARTEKELLIELGGMVRKIGEDAEGGRAEAKEGRERLRSVENLALKATEERKALTTRIDGIDKRLGGSAPLFGQVRENRDSRLKWAAAAAVVLAALGYFGYKVVLVPAETEQTSEDETEDGESNIAGEAIGEY